MAERPGPNDLQPHGSREARLRHLAHGELPCEACRERCGYRLAGWGDRHGLHQCVEPDGHPGDVPHLCTCGATREVGDGGWD